METKEPFFTELKDIITSAATPVFRIFFQYPINRIYKPGHFHSAFMGLFDKFSQPDIALEIKAKDFEISSCDFDCGECNYKFPSSVNVKQEMKLWNSTNPYDIQILISTGRNDWPHDALGESGTFANKFNEWITHVKDPVLEQLKIKVNASSLSLNDTEHEYIHGTRGDILILPYFVWIKRVDDTNLDAVLPVLRSIIQAQSKTDLLLGDQNGLHVSVDNSRAWIFLCSHRTRDKRCGITAPIMKKEMDAYNRELGLYRDYDDDRAGGVNIAFINHIGGHKYAANVVIYLKSSGKNIWLGYCTPTNVKPIIDECVLNDGKVWPEQVRMVQKFTGNDW